MDDATTGRMQDFVESIPNTVDTFLASKSSNAWIAVGPISVYLRKSQRYIEGERQFVLDIGTINIEKESEKRKGHFKALLAEIIAKCPYSFVYVENVQYDWFSAYFERNGWTRDKRYESDFCYYKKVK